MATNIQMAKREAGRKCLIKKKAIAAKLDIDTYVEKTFGVTLSEYVSDAFHSKPSKPKNTIVKSKTKIETEELIIEIDKAKPGQTVSDFITIFCKSDSKKLKALKTEIGKKVLSEEVLSEGNDMYLADLLNINRSLINGN